MKCASIRGEQCYAAEITALEAELAAKSECMDGALSDCHELIKQNAALKALVCEMGEIVQAVSLHRCCNFGSSGSGTIVCHQAPKARETIDRPEVKAIREAQA